MTCRTPTGPHLSGRSVDVCPTGVLLRLDHPVEGPTVELTFDPDAHPPIRVWGKVVRSEADRRTGRISVAVAFDDRTWAGNGRERYFAAVRQQLRS